MSMQYAASDILKRLTDLVATYGRRSTQRMAVDQSPYAHGMRDAYAQAALELTPMLSALAQHAQRQIERDQRAQPESPSRAKLAAEFLRAQQDPVNEKYAEMGLALICADIALALIAAPKPRTPC